MLCVSFSACCFAADATTYSYEEKGHLIKGEVTYPYQLFYVDEVPQIPFHINEYLSGLEV